MTGETGEPSAPLLPAAQRWADLLTGWGIPDEILAQAPESPWFHDPRRFAVDDTLDRDGTSNRWAREVLPPVGGTVLDVGCGGGRSSLALVPPASELIGVDSSGAMLDRYVAAASEAGVARRTVHGTWPAVAEFTPVADVVVCHHVMYNVGDIVPFVVALTGRARLAVVVELPVAHPMAAWAPAWMHFWGLDRPDGPTADDFVAVLRELGVDPEIAVGRRSALPAAATDPDVFVAGTRRRLCLPADRDDEIATWLVEHPPPFPDRVVTVRWPGAAELD
ncbi:class I SAM-dependent methyltransferase [Ilumatobacter sp.]|uniref:class I SAM-dependent methyltransferase n=1 Tax=Ilumatobacter sp. TaxID=1967498 RepID=UPI003AF60715